jgi:hypothetical protein
VGTKSGHEVAPWNGGLKVMFHKAGQDMYNLKGLALANTIQHTKIAKCTIKGNGRKEKRME